MYRSDHDVIIVGAGMAGISASYHLLKQHPHLKVLILESRDNLGGTWDLYRYPGVRCDSDMFTYGFDFYPWSEKNTFASGEQIQKYLKETVDKFNLLKLMNFGMLLKEANWSSEHACWSLKVIQKGLEQPKILTCRYLLMCTGYFSYQQGYLPEIPGIGRFKGTIIDPQHWPDNISLSESNVAVIGSGATAISLAPALAKTAKSVTMIQRTPSYIFAKSIVGLFSELLHRLLPTRLFIKFERHRSLFALTWFVNFARYFPVWAKHWFLTYMRKHFANTAIDIFDIAPPYFPWQQRICITPDGEFFESVKSGRIRIETSNITHIDEKGLELSSASFIPADVIVMATGFNIEVYGGVRISVDGQLKTLSDSVTYKGAMLSGIPNFIYFSGYSKLPWTIRVGLVAKFVCRLLRYMNEHNYSACTPILNENKDMFLTRLNRDFMPGYLQRNAHLFPQSGDRFPWKAPESYHQDLGDLLKKPIKESHLLLD
jgi:cation diffusion facilitator CzcD-associated flavoprotein CzcO